MNAHDYTTLSAEQWGEIIKKSKNDKLLMFILRNWANSQRITAGAVNAFKGVVDDSNIARKTGSLSIGRITKFVKAVTGDDEAICYCWSKPAGEWIIGYHNTKNLKKAFAKIG